MSANDKGWPTGPEDLDTIRILWTDGLITWHRGGDKVVYPRGAWPNQIAYWLAIRPMSKAPMDTTRPHCWDNERDDWRRSNAITFQPRVTFVKDKP